VAMIGTIAKLIGGLVGALFLLGAVLVLWPRSAAPLPEAGLDYVIEGVRVVDVVAGTAGPPTSVTVRKGIIAAIGDANPAAGLVRVVGRGRFLAPGFWDMHVHSFQHSPQTDFPIFVAHGVTNVRDMMDCPGARDSLIGCIADKRRWNAEGEAGELTAPRIVEVASYYLEDPELGPGEVTRRILDYHGRGIDAIKVYNRLAPTAFHRAADVARARGMRLVGHLPKQVALDEALTTGQSSFEHGHVFPRHCFGGAADWREGRLDDLSPTERTEAMVAGHDPKLCSVAFDAFRSAGAWYVPTHVTREEDARAGDPGFVEDPRLDWLDPLSRWAYRDDLAGTRAAYPGARGEQALRDYFELGLRLTGEAHRAGVQVLVGTDTANGGFRYHDELAHLVRAGLSPAEVLRAATIDAARYAGLEASSGSIEIGKRADLVLLDANPLETIGNAGRINAVFLGGRLYDRNRLDRLLEFALGQAGAPQNWAKLLWAFAWSSVTSDL
jgi:hypothetical protein